MGLENTKAQYQIEITRTGEGAKQAVQDFKAVQTQALASSEGLTSFSNSSKAAKDSLQLLRSSAVLVGFEIFPRFTTHAMAASQALGAVSRIAGITGAGLGTLGIAFSGVTAVVVTAVKAFEAFKAASQYEASMGNWQNQLSAFYGSAQTQAAGAQGRIDALLQTGGITKDWAGVLQQNLQPVSSNAEWRENINNVKASLTEIEKTAVAAKRLSELEATMVRNQLQGFDKERAAAYDLYAERIKQVEELTSRQGKWAGQYLSEFGRREAGGELDATLARLEAQKQLNQATEAHARLQQELNDLERKYTLEALTGSKSRKDLAEEEYQAKIALLQKYHLTEEEMMRMSEQANIQRLQGMVQVNEQLTETQKILEQTKQLFATGMAAAMVSFISGTKSAKEAFREFAASFMQEVARMILAQQILKAFSALGMSGGGMAFAAAQGGMFPTYAANGLSGVTSVSSPTYFPKFNVVAGEAGREMLTVLARPRMMEIGGMQAVVGNAGNNRLAITNADQLAGRGAGGLIVIEVRGTPDFEARVVSNSVEGASVRVANDLKRDTPISRGVKGLTG